MLINYIKLLRPHQWLKNLLLLFPPFFAGKIADPAVIKLIVPALAAFSCAASCGYIMNDIKDLEADRNHETKKHRALANGSIPASHAIVLAVILYVASVMLTVSIPGEGRRFQWFLFIYILSSFLYTFYFKNIVLADIFLIAFGFLLRVLAGGEAFSIPVTNWLFLTVFAVSLFLAAGKRLGEKISLGENAQKHRKSLSHYTVSFLDGILWFSASAACVMYALYTIEHKNGLFYTVPLAAYGLLRYAYIVKEGRDDPTEVLLSDPHIMGIGTLWTVMIALIIY